MLSWLSANWIALVAIVLDVALSIVYVIHYVKKHKKTALDRDLEKVKKLQKELDALKKKHSLDKKVEVVKHD